MSVLLNFVVAVGMTTAIYYVVVGHENFVDHLHTILVKLEDQWRGMSK